MTDYTINWTDDSLKAPFTVVGGTIDTTTTSLALHGKSSLNWGERLQENLIHLLENFASNNIPPAAPTTGQFWFNNSSKYLSVYYNSGWHELRWRIIYNAIAPTGTFYPGDLWYDTTENILKVYTNNGFWVTTCSQCLPATPTPTIPGATPTPSPTPTSITLDISGLAEVNLYEHAVAYGYTPGMDVIVINTTHVYSSNTAIPALTIPATFGTGTITFNNSGNVYGMGGRGGPGAVPGGVGYLGGGGTGFAGGPAIKLEYPVTINNTGLIAGGGGGGGGGSGANCNFWTPGGGGGGGRSFWPSPGGTSIYGINNNQIGQESGPGQGGVGGGFGCGGDCCIGGSGGPGGTWGSPGAVGGYGQLSSSVTSGGPGGAAGAAIIGHSTYFIGGTIGSTAGALL